MQTVPNVRLHMLIQTILVNFFLANATRILDVSMVNHLVHVQQQLVTTFLFAQPTIIRNFFDMDHFMAGKVALCLKFPVTDVASIGTVFCVHYFVARQVGRLLETFLAHVTTVRSIVVVDEFLVDQKLVFILAAVIALIAIPQSLRSIFLPLQRNFFFANKTAIVDCALLTQVIFKIFHGSKGNAAYCAENLGIKNELFFSNHGRSFFFDFLFYRFYFYLNSIPRLLFCHICTSFLHFVLINASLL